jgi:NTE family protein
MKINGVFEGGGVRGVALAGAAAAALDLGYEFDQVVGTSAGALVASLLAADYSADELSASVCAVDWPELLDPVPGAGIPLVGKHLALITRRGIFHSKRLETVWGGLLADHGVRTFADVRPRSLGIVATDLSHSRGVVFPAGLARYGHDPARFSIARAVRMSAAVPFLFTPVTLHDRLTGEKVMMADGAMAANYPVGVVRRDRPVLGFRLVADGDGHDHHHVGGPLSLARSVMIAGIRARYSLPRLIDSGAHVIQVPVSDDLDFEMSNEEARRVFDRGRAAAADQLADLDLARPRNGRIHDDGATFDGSHVVTANTWTSVSG